MTSCWAGADPAVGVGSRALVAVPYVPEDEMVARDKDEEQEDVAAEWHSWLVAGGAKGPLEIRRVSWNDLTDRVEWSSWSGELSTPGPISQLLALPSPNLIAAVRPPSSPGSSSSLLVFHETRSVSLSPDPSLLPWNYAWSSSSSSSIWLGSSSNGLQQILLEQTQFRRGWKGEWPCSFSPSTPALDVRGTCDPLQHSLIYAGQGALLCAWDTRSSSAAVLQINVSAVPALGLTALEPNPNQPHHLLTGSKDGALQVWDTRRACSSSSCSSPPLLLAVPQAHDHACSLVACNRFHDQLVLSAGTDASVALWSLAAVSSARHEQSGEPDRLLRRFDQHNESVTAVSWSAHDPWVYASLGYDGQLAFHRVDNADKYRILL